MRFPAILIYPADASTDPLHGEEPDLIEQSIVVTLISPAMPGDATGEKAMIGGNTATFTASEGRGLLAFDTEINDAIGRLQTDSGVVIASFTSGATRVQADPQLGYILWRDYTFKAYVTMDRFYHPCVNLTATGGAGQVVLAWSVPPDRYDRYRVVLRRATGATAPASISAGTGVSLSANLATSVTDSGLGAGTYSYALFGTYDQVQIRPASTPDSDDQSSAAVTRTSITVS